MVTDVFRELIERQGITIYAFGQRMGVTRSAVTDRLKMKNPTIKVMREMADALGYRFVLIPKDKPLPKGCYELPEGEGEKR